MRYRQFINIVIVVIAILERTSKPNCLLARSSRNRCRVIIIIVLFPASLVVEPQVVLIADGFKFLLGSSSFAIVRSLLLDF